MAVYIRSKNKAELDTALFSLFFFLLSNWGQCLWHACIEELLCRCDLELLPVHSTKLESK